MNDRLQRQRFENKYVVTEHIALAVRDFVSLYLDLDEYGATQPDYSYPVHTLYLDSPGLALYRHTINGDRNRFKLRVRFYENGADSPVFLEVKRRANNAILKRRAAVRRSDVQRILAGHGPDCTYLVEYTPEALRDLHTFCALVDRLQAQPQAHVAYRREAWIAQGETSVRVTIDRWTTIERRHRLSLDPDMEVATDVFGNRVVLELKFTDRYPIWFNELVQLFGLTQGPAAKYADGVYRMGEFGRMSVYV